MEEYIDQETILRMEQNRQDQDPNSLYADYMREEKVINVIQQLNPDNLLEDIEHRIRGQKKNKFNAEWEKIDSSSNKKVSGLLIENYISFLGSLLNQNTSLSNFSNTEINNLMIMIIEHVRDDLADNAEEYGFVKNKTITINKPVEILRTVVLSDGSISKIITSKRNMDIEVIINSTTDFNEMNRIGMIICGTTFSVFKRALNGMEARRVFGALKVTESLNQGNKKKGIMDALKFWS
jgi:hypothetical protein